MVRKFDPVSKGNPHELTINQHIFPKKSIDRFCNQKGLLQVKRDNKIFDTNSDNDGIFCAKRVWDQRAESGYMKTIEDEFQELAERIVLNPFLVKISSAENRIITKFYALWICRYFYSKNPEAAIQIFANRDDYRGFDKQDSEGLEKLGGIVIAGNSISSRHTTGMMIYDQVTNIYSNLISNSNWGVLISGDENKYEFLVPDCFRLFTAIPLTPKLCLYSQTETKIIDDEDVRKVNSFAVSSAIDYVFSKNLSKC